MSGSGGGKRGSIIDKIGRAASPKLDGTDLSGRPVWWWIFLMPGTVILWIEYMFPHRFAGVFGTARRRNIPLLQILYSLSFYLLVLIFVLLLFFHSRNR